MIKKTIFYLVLTMIFSFCVLGQESVTPKPTKKPTAEESWKTFYSNLKTAVINRDRKFIESVLTTAIACQSWNICKFTNGMVIGNSDMIFRKWSENGNRYWLVLKRTLESGKLESRGNDVDGFGNEVAWKWQRLMKTECEGSDLEFEFENGRWRITEFTNGRDGWCGH